jgi:hypothetical protein
MWCWLKLRAASSKLRLVVLEVTHVHAEFVFECKELAKCPIRRPRYSDVAATAFARS